MAGGSANVSNIVSFGGYETTSNLTLPESNPAGYFTIYAQCLGGTFYAFFRNGVQYQVGLGKTCKVVRITAWSSTASAQFQVASSTATFSQGAGSITGPVYQFGAISLTGMICSPTASVAVGYSMPYDFTSQTYPCAQSNTSGVNIALLCKEV
jgi:hypothetical protein